MNHLKRTIANELIPVYETDNGEKVVDGRELHEFLRIGRDFTTWIKERVQKYGFIEGEDFSSILGKTSEQGGRPTIEYILKLDVAKELCMVENNEQGSMARKYFVEVEKRFKEQSINTSLLSPEMQMFKHMFDGVARMQLEQAETKRQLENVQTAVTSIKDTIIQRDDDWRKSIKHMFNKTVLATPDRDFPTLRNESYRILEERAHCDLSRRLRFLLERLTESGATKTKLNETSKLDVIESDPKLKEIYSNIVKELYIRFAS